MATTTALSTRDWLLAGKPTGTWYESVPYESVNIDQAIGASGVMITVAVPIFQGSVLSKVTFAVGATAASTPTHSFVALYGPGTTAMPLLASSADGTTTVAAANTLVTVSFATAYTTPTTDVYYVG